MSSLFKGTTFNDNIHRWDVSKVTSMLEMFQDNQVFNQPLNRWNVENVVDTTRMFQNATSFNRRLELWKVQKVLTARSMFQGATAFNRNLCVWGDRLDKANADNEPDVTDMFAGTACADESDPVFPTSDDGVTTPLCSTCTTA